MEVKQNKKINLLVVPDQFPENDEDIAGVFILNYLKCVEPYCNITVFHNKLIGTSKGVKSNWFLNRFWVIRNVVISKKVPIVLKPLFYIFWLIKGLRLSKKFENVDLIHAHGTILGGTLALLLSKKMKVPFVLTEHVGPYSKISGNFFKKYWAGIIMQKAEKVFTVSEHLKNEILNADLEPRDMIVTHNPVDTEFFKLKRTSGCKRFGFASRIVNFKGGLRVLKAFHLITEEFPDWKFVIGGEGPDSYLIKNYIKKNNLEDRVEYRGYLSRDGLNNLFESVDFFVFPSKHESFGLVVAEAMAKGLPVIGPNITGPSEFIDSNSGILINPLNIWEISRAIKKMIHGHQFYDSLAIRRNMIAMYGLESYGLKLMNQYCNVLNLELISQKVGEPCVELQD